MPVGPWPRIMCRMVDTIVSTRASPNHEALPLDLFKEEFRIGPIGCIQKRGMPSTIDCIGTAQSGVHAS